MDDVAAKGRGGVCGFFVRWPTVVRDDRDEDVVRLEVLVDHAALVDLGRVQVLQGRFRTDVSLIRASLWRVRYMSFLEMCVLHCKVEEAVRRQKEEAKHSDTLAGL